MTPPEDPAPTRPLLVRRLVLGSLGFVHLIAFASLWSQVEGLLGSEGIVPASETLAAASRALEGADRWLRVPTLLWWGAGDAALHALCAAGVLLSVAGIVGLAPRVVFSLAWVVTLSLVSVGSPFLSFQWDVLLLEAGLLAVVFAPPGARARWAEWGPLATAGLWGFRWLLFRLVFTSGLVKLASGDPTWRDLSALDFHHWTQPLPHWVAWYADALPPAVDRLSTLAALALEIGAPCLIFGGRRARIVAAAAITGLMALVSATGNYGFFTLLTVVLCLSLLDDRALARIGLRPPARPLERPSPARAAVAIAIAVPVVVLTSTAMFLRLGLSAPLPWPVAGLRDAAAPFRSFNAYGLFAVMTTKRPEILVEGSRDGVEWRRYDFRWKPGDLDRAPRFAGFHMPRLDWQAWFAALGRCEGTPWFLAFERRLLLGSPPVLSLLARDPFPEGPPRFVRSTVYDYRFTKPGSGGRDWWTRERVREYCPTLTLGPDGSLRVAGRE